MSAAAGEPTYTLAQAQAELIRQECAAQGHVPSLFTVSGYHGDCRCGDVHWEGTKRDA